MDVTKGRRRFLTQLRNYQPRRKEQSSISLMERSLARSGARLRSSRIADNQRSLEDVSAFSASKSSSTSSPEGHGREILLRLLKQITEFLERKEMMSTRLAASKEWRKSRSRRRSESNNLFEVVIQVCEQRMRRLKRSVRWVATRNIFVFFSFIYCCCYLGRLWEVTEDESGRSGVPNLHECW